MSQVSHVVEPAVKSRSAEALEHPGIDLGKSHSTARGQPRQVFMIIAAKGAAGVTGAGRTTLSVDNPFDGLSLEPDPHAAPGTPEGEPSEKAKVSVN